jgi:Skp family chaperone for outer membrane proteins
MNILAKSAFLASLMLTAGAHPALAQTAASPPIAGIGVANLDAVIGNSNAFRTAEQQRPVTYKAQFDQAEARRKALTAQIQPMVDKFTRDSQAPNANQALLAQQAQALQKLQESGQAELQRILEPVGLSQAYVQEQIGDKLDQAVKQAMTKQKISLLLNPQAIVALNNTAYNLNQSILNELNTLLPSAQLVPPQGWEPREVREAKAAQAAQGAQGAAQAAPAAPAGPQPQGR